MKPELENLDAVMYIMKGYGIELNTNLKTVLKYVKYLDLRDDIRSEKGIILPIVDKKQVEVELPTNSANDLHFDIEVEKPAVENENEIYFELENEKILNDFMETIIDQKPLEKVEQKPIVKDDFSNELDFFLKTDFSKSIKTKIVEPCEDIITPTGTVIKDIVNKDIKFPTKEELNEIRKPDMKPKVENNVNTNVSIDKINFTLNDKTQHSKEENIPVSKYTVPIGTILRNGKPNQMSENSQNILYYEMSKINFKNFDLVKKMLNEKFNVNQFGELDDTYCNEIRTELINIQETINNLQKY